MTSCLRASLLALTLASSAGLAIADEPSLAQLVVDSGEFSGADLDFWVTAARMDRDRAEFRKIVERETRRLESQRTETPAENAYDAKRDAISGPLKDYLARQEAERQRALDPKAEAISGPLKDYLEQVEALERDAGEIDPKAEAISGPLKDYLKKQARMRDLVAARAQGVDGELKTAQAVERWTRVVVDSTGEVIVDDPVDVAHARLEDLARRQAEVLERLNAQPQAAEFRAAIAELDEIDARIDDAMRQITGTIWRRRSAKRGICHPPAEKGKPVAAFNCNYWALETPMTLPGGEKIILDRVELEVDEDQTRAPYRASIRYYWRYSGQPPRDEPQSNQAGEIRHGSNGELSLVITETDEDGEEREMTYPMTLSTGAAMVRAPGFDGHGPFQFSFKRDPAAYIPWADYLATAQGKAPDRRSPPALSDDDLLVPLTPPAASEDDLLVPLTPPAASDDDLLVPLTPPAASDDDLLVPLTPPAASDDDLLVPLTPPAASDDDLLVPLTPPASGEDDLLVPLTPPAAGEDDLLVPLTPPASAEDDFLVPLTPMK